MTEVQEAMKTLVVNHFWLEVFLVRSFMRKKLKPPIIAILKRFIPNATIPPSAKKTACIVKTRLMLKIAAYGPRRTAKNVPPTKCPLDPKIIGKLIICAANTKALEIARITLIERL
jgi:hypothetical protein